jgi:LacI family transcriptional regulator
MMMEHAASCGARNVAVIGEAAFTQLALRVRGICNVARSAGISVELIGQGNWNNAQDGFELGRMLASRPQTAWPDFVIGLTDVLAAGAIDGIIATGLSVPDDMLVAGCDGNPLAWNGPISLTTISSPGYEIGRRGVRQLLTRLEGRTNDERLCELVPPLLLVRASTSPSYANASPQNPADTNLAEYLTDGTPS